MIADIYISLISRIDKITNQKDNQMEFFRKYNIVNGSTPYPNANGNWPPSNKRIKKVLVK